MADFEIPEEPEYNRNIRRFETTDPAHADLFNAVAQTLINNDEFLKRTVEQQKETVLEKTGDAGDTTVTFTSGDTENPEDWTEITPVESGEKQSSLWQKISLFAKNLRYLWKLCGTSDISGVADGTLTGAVSKLNTDLQGVSGLKFIDFGRYDYYTMSIDDCIKDIFSKIPLEDQYTYFGRFVRGQEYKVIVQSYPYRTYGSVLLFGYASEIVLYTEGEGVITKHETNWTLTVI